jgi:pimeloyl-ACP methyl ester carboxylesterase
MAESKTMNVYFISGLGADRRAFERLSLSDKYAVHYLDWIEPIKNESLNEYARRLSASIDTSQPFSIIGLSMGGMIACAMTDFLHPYKTVLISSIGCNKEFPPLLRFAKKTKAYKLLPRFIFRSKNLGVIQRLFGTKARNEKALIRYFISQTSPRFMKWAIDAIVNWQNCERPKQIFHIHGNADKMFPIKYTKPDAVIDKGSHFMVWTKAGEVSKILEQALA